MTFGEKLNVLRQSQRMSQEELARKLGVSRQAISRWELGEVVPDTANVLAVSRLFGVSTDYLLLNECEREGETPVVQAAEESMAARQRKVGAAMLIRFFWLSPVILYHQGRINLMRDPSLEPLPTLYLLALQIVFSALLFRQLWRYHEREEGSWNPLLIYDSLAAASVLVLPYLLDDMLGSYSVLLAVIIAATALVRSIRLLRLHYGLPWRKARTKRL